MQGKYKVTAHCGSRKCKDFQFTVIKKKIVKTSTGGSDYIIENVVCPQCSMWADVVDIVDERGKSVLAKPGG